MKKILVLAVSIVCSSSLFAQKMSCCANPSTTGQFASMGTDKNFIAAHMEPIAHEYDQDLGRSIVFKTPDGKKGNGFEILSNYGTDKYLFIFHEWWGLNGYIKDEAVRYFKQLKDVNVIAIDLYDGETTTNRDEAGKLMQAVEEDRARAIIEGAIKYVGKKAKIATVGWCFGGGWSLQASIMAGKQAYGCVMYYGMPEKNVDKLKTLNADVLGLFANKDQWITPAVVEEFKKNMEAANKSLIVKTYDEDHAFANPSNPIYSKESADKAYAQAIQFIKAHLQR